MMEAGQVYRMMLFLSVSVSVFGLVSPSSGIRMHGAANPPKDVLSRIENTRKPLNGEAHIFPTTVTRTATNLTITINFSALPAHVSLSLFILDELYLNLQTAGGSHLWIEERLNKTPLARVQLNPSQNGYRAIKMRRVFASWQANSQRTGSLELKLPSTQTQLATKLETTKSYFVIYTHSLLIIPKSVKCHSYDVTIKPHTPMNAGTFVTKICSPPDDVTFPYSASRFFDMAAAFRKSLKDDPVPGNDPVMRNPKCCHGTKAVPRRFVSFDPIGIVRLENVQITKCGCGM